MVVNIKTMGYPGNKTTCVLKTYRLTVISANQNIHFQQPEAFSLKP